MKLILFVVMAFAIVVGAILESQRRGGQGGRRSPTGHPGKLGGADKHGLVPNPRFHRPDLVLGVELRAILHPSPSEGAGGSDAKSYEASCREVVQELGCPYAVLHAEAQVAVVERQCRNALRLLDVDRRPADPDAFDARRAREAALQLDLAFCLSDLGRCAEARTAAFRAAELWRGLRSQPGIYHRWLALVAEWHAARCRIDAGETRAGLDDALEIAAGLGSLADDAEQRGLDVAARELRALRPRVLHSCAFAAESSSTPPSDLATFTHRAAQAYLAVDPDLLTTDGSERLGAFVRSLLPDTSQADGVAINAPALPATGDPAGCAVECYHNAGIQASERAPDSANLDFERAFRVASRTLDAGGDPVLRVMFLRLANLLGTRYEGLGAFERAAGVMDAAIARLDGAPPVPAEQCRLGGLLCNRALLHAGRCDFTAAEAAAQRAVEVLSKVGVAADPEAFQVASTFLVNSRGLLEECRRRRELGLAEVEAVVAELRQQTLVAIPAVVPPLLDGAASGPLCDEAARALGERSPDDVLEDLAARVDVREGLSAVAGALLRTGRARDALALLRTDEATPDVWPAGAALHAEALRCDGRAREAVAAAEAVVRAAPDVPLYHVLEGLARFDAAFERAPKGPASVGLVRLDELEAAARAFEEALVLDPDQVLASGRRACALCLAVSLDALQLRNVAACLDRTTVATHAARAEWLQLALGRWSERLRIALDAARAALDAGAELGDAPAALAERLLDLGAVDRPDTRLAFELVQRARPDSARTAELGLRLAAARDDRPEARRWHHRLEPLDAERAAHWLTELPWLATKDGEDR
ncbi:MAG: hypothetical protein IPM29_23865 [Planctomycetes bacterium]|nr:hypothetical protein [Planctomycetota bacterium]